MWLWKPQSHNTSSGAKKMGPGWISTLMVMGTASCSVSCGEGAAEEQQTGGLPFVQAVTHTSVAQDIQPFHKSKLEELLCSPRICLSSLKE